MIIKKTKLISIKNELMNGKDLLLKANYVFDMKMKIMSKGNHKMFQSPQNVYCEVYQHKVLQLLKLYFIIRNRER